MLRTTVLSTNGMLLARGTTCATTQRRSPAKIVKPSLEKNRIQKISHKTQFHDLKSLRTFRIQRRKNTQQRLRTIVRARDQGGSPAIGTKAQIQELLKQTETKLLLTATGIGLLTGITVVLFNMSIHALHDSLILSSLVSEEVLGGAFDYYNVNDWDKALVGNPAQVVLVPVLGGLMVTFIQMAKDTIEAQQGDDKPEWLAPVSRALSAIVTLGTGNSLGPEGPSVEIGTAVSRFVPRWAGTSKTLKQSSLSLTAAGSAAGVAAGFSAAIGGAFFAVETVLQKAKDMSKDKKPEGGLTSEVVLLAAIAAQVMSSIGLGTEPAFHIPVFDIITPLELPLYLPLGLLCGGYALWFQSAVTYSEGLFEQIEDTGLPRKWHPPLGGLCTGLIALAFPEVLYNGFANVDAILQEGITLHYSVPLLIQVVAAKCLATSLCKGSGLVGGIYAPSLMAGAAIGSAYGQLLGDLCDLSPIAFSVAPSQAYALVGMASALGSVCSVPLTALLLVFELSNDATIIVPLMISVSVASYIGSLRQDRMAPPPPLPPSTATTTTTTTTPLVEVETVGVNSSSELDTPSALTVLATSPNAEYCQSKVQEELLNSLEVKSAMKSDFIKVSPDLSGLEALDLLVESEVVEAVVVEETQDDDDDDVRHVALGVLTLPDLQQAIRDESAESLKQGGGLTGDSLRVSSVFNPEAPLEHHASLQAALTRLQQTDTPVLTVEEDGTPVGVIDDSMIMLAVQLSEAKLLLEDNINAEVLKTN